MSKSITQQFTITTSRSGMRKIERFLALLHWNSRFGHSATFGVHWDGDGHEKVTVEPEPNHATEVNFIGGVGGDLEVAYSDGYGCYMTKSMGSQWEAKMQPFPFNVPTLLKNGKVYKQAIDKALPAFGSNLECDTKGRSDSDA